MKNILKRHELAGLTLLEALYPAKLKQPRHTHTQASFSFVLDGDYLESYETKAQVRQPSTIIFHPPQESHSVDYGSEPVRILSVHLDFKRLAYIREYSDILDSSTSRRTETTARLGRRLYQEFCRMDAVSALGIEALVLEILADASRPTPTAERRTPHWIRRVEEFLHDNFSESFAVHEIAKIAGVHPVHLARVFRERNGCTMGEYVRRLRVEFARHEIAATQTPLGEIAITAGFADQSHLTRTFKSYLAITPSEYRKVSRPR
jgi:AraC family transcriptional regulator